MHCKSTKKYGGHNSGILLVLSVDVIGEDVLLFCTK